MVPMFFNSINTINYSQSIVDSPEDLTTLTRAVELGDSALVKQILDLYPEQVDERAPGISVWGHSYYDDPFVYQGEEEGESALEIAIGTGNLDIVKILLERGADPRLQRKIYGAVGEYVKLVNIKNAPEQFNEGDVVLAKTVSLQGEVPYRINTPLYKAIYSGHHEIVKALLEHGSDVSWVTRDYTFPAWGPWDASASDIVMQVRPADAKMIELIQAHK